MERKFCRFLLLYTLSRSFLNNYFRFENMFPWYLKSLDDLFISCRYKNLFERYIRQFLTVILDKDYRYNRSVCFQYFYHRIDNKTAFLLTLKASKRKYFCIYLSVYWLATEYQILIYCLMLHDRHNVVLYFWIHLVM